MSPPEPDFSCKPLIHKDFRLFLDYLGRKDGCWGGIESQPIQLAWAGVASGCTASRNPIALRMADKLLSAGLPFGESVR